jgi:hypothetical protein
MYSQIVFNDYPNDYEKMAAYDNNLFKIGRIGLSSAVSSNSHKAVTERSFSENMLVAL